MAATPTLQKFGWLTPSQIVRDFGIPRSYPLRWSKQGHLSLGGKKLRWRPNPANFRYRQYHREDVQTIVASLNRTPQDEIRVGGAVWVWAGEAARRIGVCTSTLQRNASLRRRKEPSLSTRGRGVRERLYYHATDLEALLQSESPSDTSKDWLLPGEVLSLLGIHLTTLIRWREKGCPALNGNRLTVQRVSGPSKFRPEARSNVRYLYKSDDVLQIADARRSSGDSFTDAQGRTWLDATAARRRTGVSAVTLHDWHSNGHPLLDGKKVDRQQRRVFVAGENRLQAKWFYLESDLDLVVRARAEAVDSGTGQEGWLTRTEVAQRFGVTRTTVLEWEAGCVHLDGQPLDVREFEVRIGGRKRKRKHYRLDQIEEIERSRKPEGHWALNHGNQPYMDHEGTWLSHRQGAERFGMRFRLAWANRIGGSTPFDGHVRAKRIKNPSGARNYDGLLWVYHESDFLNLLAKLNAGEEPKLKAAGAAKSGGQSAGTAVDPQAGGGPERTSEAEEQDGSPAGAVVLQGRGKPVVVLGKQKGALTKAQYDVVEALLIAGENGLSKDSLEVEGRHSDARRILKRLADRDPDWGRVIFFPGRGGQGLKYRIFGKP